MQCGGGIDQLRCKNTTGLHAKHLGGGTRHESFGGENPRRGNVDVKSVLMVALFPKGRYICELCNTQVREVIVSHVFVWHRSRFFAYFSVVMGMEPRTKSPSPTHPSPSPIPHPALPIPHPAKNSQLFPLAVPSFCPCLVLVQGSSSLRLDWGLSFHLQVVRWSGSRRGKGTGEDS